MTRDEISVSIWLNNFPLNTEQCEQAPFLKDYGLYRKLDDGRLEFVSVCNPEIRRYLSMHENDYKKLLDKYVPED